MNDLGLRVNQKMIYTLIPWYQTFHEIDGATMSLI